MTVTNATRSLIAKTIREKGISKKSLADSVGLKQSWVTKLMNGTIKSLSDEQERQVEALLGIKLRRFVADVGLVSQLALAAEEAIKRDSRVATMIESLLSLENDAQVNTPRWIETQDMTKIGQEIIRIAFANEDKPGKVAREVLKLLA